MKRRLLLFLLMITLPVATIPIATLSAPAPLLEVSSVGAPRGDTVSVPISLTGSGIYGGSFNVQYDAAALNLVSAVGVSGSVVNKNYADDMVRISFASADQEVSGTLLTLTFRVEADAPYGPTALTLSGVGFTDGNKSIAVETRDGTLTVQSASIVINPAKGVIGQAVLVSVELSGELLPAGGGFEIVYDNTKLAPINVKESALMLGKSFSKNLAYSADSIKVNWAAGEPLPKTGELFTMSFRILDGVSEGETPLRIAQLRLYDEHSKEIDSQAFGANVTMEFPEGSIPEIILSKRTGGSADELVVLVSVRGSDMVCGVNLELNITDNQNLTFLSTKALNGTATISAEPDANGRIKIAWATPIPVAKATHLAEIVFRESGGASSALPVTTHSATFHDADGVPIDCKIETELGQVSIGEGIVVIGQGAPDVVSSSNGVEVSVSLALDTTDIQAEGVQTVDVIVALYDSDKFLGVELKSITLDKEATVAETITAEAGTHANTCKIMILSADARATPLCGNLQYEL